jgi:hypothetical protein
VTVHRPDWVNEWLTPSAMAIEALRSGPAADAMPS